MLTLTDIEAMMDKARAKRDAARAEAERNTQLLVAYADQLQALTELHRVTQTLVMLDPPALALFDAAMAQAGAPTLPPVPPRPPMPIAPEPPSAGWKRRARTAAPEPGPASRAGKVLAWLRANPTEDGHQSQAVALAVMGPAAKGWMVSTQLSMLYHAGLLQRRELVPRQPGGMYAYRARLLDKEPTPG